MSACTLVAAALAGAAAGPVRAQGPAAPMAGPKLRVAVSDLSGAALKMQMVSQPTVTTTTIALPPPAEFARGLTEMLTTALVATGRFVVLERAALSQITAEQDAVTAGRIGKETGAATGALTGAQALITGEVTEFSYQQSSLGGGINVLKSVRAKTERIQAMVALDIRLVDTATGEVLFSRRCEGRAAATGIGTDLTLAGQAFTAHAERSTPLGRASRDAIDQAVAALSAAQPRIPWTARIIDVRDELIYLNAGRQAGVAPGMRFEVVEQEAPLVDPETGRTLGAPERRVGVIEVTAVEEGYATARAVDGGNFKRNHAVRVRTGERSR